MSDRFDLLADRLAERVAEEVAARVGEMLDQRASAPPPLLDAKQAAAYLGVDRSAVYEMARAGRIPCLRLGDTDRPRLRFDARVLAEHLGAVEEPLRRSNGRPRSRGPSTPASGLLPIQGDSE